DQGAHVPGQGAQQGAGQEQDRARDEDGFAAEGVGQLAVDREGDRDGEQVAGEQPGEVGEAAEVPDDLQDGGGDDGGVQRRRGHGRHQGGDDGPAPVGGGRGCAGAGRRTGAAHGGVASRRSVTVAHVPVVSFPAPPDVGAPCIYLLRDSFALTLPQREGAVWTPPGGGSDPETVSP